MKPKKNGKLKRRSTPIEERTIQPPGPARIHAEAEGPGFDPAPNEQYVAFTPPVNQHSNVPDNLQRATMQMAALGLNPKVVYPFGYIVRDYRTGEYTVWPTEKVLEERRRISQARYNAEFPPLRKRGQQEAEITPRKDPPKKLMNSLFAPKAPPKTEDNRAATDNKNMFSGDEYKQCLSVPATEEKGKQINRQNILEGLVEPSAGEQTPYSNDVKLQEILKNAKAIWENPKFKGESSKETVTQQKDSEDNASNFEEDLERKRSKQNKHYYGYKCSDKEIFETKNFLMERFLRDCDEHISYMEHNPIFSHLEHRNRWSEIYNPSNIWHSFL